MKRLLLCSAAIGAIAVSAPAHAQIDVTVGGHTKNYVGWLDQDTAANAEERSFDMARESEVHVNAEGVADNGLVYGFHVEMEVDGGDSAGTLEESYLYLSGDWGRINAGSENGSAYLLQVAAPSADSNIDGIRQYIQPVNGTVATAAGTNIRTYLTAQYAAGGDGMDYDNDATAFAEKLTYLSPIWNGFQFGVSYTPDTGDAGSADAIVGFNADDAAGAFGEAYEGAVRYEGEFNNVGFALGAGYTHNELEATGAGATANFDDLHEWNIGLDLDMGPFGAGIVWTENNNGRNAGDEDQTLVLGVDYTTGPFKLGASYYTREDEAGLAAGEHEIDRYTGGVVYTAAPGLSFRGSLSHIEHESATAGEADVEATSLLGGIQMNF